MVEVVIVMVLIGLLAGIAIPSVTGVQKIIYDIQLDGVAKKLATDLRWLQQATINSGLSHYYVLHFNLYTDPQLYYILDNITVTKKITLTDIIVVSAPSQDIMFSTDGVPNQGHTIILKHKYSGKMKELTVVPATGRVMVK